MKFIHQASEYCGKKLHVTTTQYVVENPHATTLANTKNFFFKPIKMFDCEHKNHI